MNGFIEGYERLRKQGYNELESFGITSGAIAINGSFKDLETLYSHYLKDFLSETEKFFNEVEEFNNETA